VSLSPQVNARMVPEVNVPSFSSTRFKVCYFLILSFDAMWSVYLHKTNVQERYCVDLLWFRFLNLDCMYFLFYPQIA